MQRISLTSEAAATACGAEPLPLMAAANCMPSRKNTHLAEEKHRTPLVYRFSLQNDVRFVARFRRISRILPHHLAGLVMTSA
jgi:hypothetical protein